MTHYEISHVLFMSTTHGKKEDFEEGGYIAENASYSSEYGNLLVAEQHTAELHGEDTPDHLVPILELAARLKCDYIAFDRDATPYDELTEYDW